MVVACWLVLHLVDALACSWRLKHHHHWYRDCVSYSQALVVSVRCWDVSVKWGSTVYGQCPSLPLNAISSGFWFHTALQTHTHNVNFLWLVINECGHNLGPNLPFIYSLAVVKSMVHSIWLYLRPCFIYVSWLLKLPPCTVFLVWHWEALDIRHYLLLYTEG